MFTRVSHFRWVILTLMALFGLSSATIVRSEPSKVMRDARVPGKEALIQLNSSGPWETLTSSMPVGPAAKIWEHSLESRYSDENSQLAKIDRSFAKLRAEKLEADVHLAQKQAREAELNLFRAVGQQAELAHRSQAGHNGPKAAHAVQEVAHLTSELRALTSQEGRLQKIMDSIHKGKPMITTVAGRIPKIVHHIYKLDLSHGPWPNKIWQASFNSWLHHFPEPEYEHLFWPDTNASEFFRLRCPDHYATYRSAQRDIVRADLARYCILSSLGGIYADMDYEPRKNFYDRLVPGAVNLVQSPYSSETFQNSLMASNPGNDYWGRLLNLAVGRTRKKNDVLLVSGPQLLEGLSDTHDPKKVHMLPCNEFQRATHSYPLEAQSARRKHCRLLQASDADDGTLMGIHWGTVSWLGGGNKDTMKLFSAFHAPTKK